MTERRQPARQGVSVEHWLELIAGGENLEVEFKSDARRLSDGDLVDAVVCMANGNGGTLFLGVEDDGRITGLHPTHEHSARQIGALLANQTAPPLSVVVYVFELVSDGVPREIAALEIPAARVPVATSSGRVLMRYTDSRGRPGCRPLYPYELEGWRADRGLVDPSATPIGDADLDALDALEIARLRRFSENYRGDASLAGLGDRELLGALGLVTPDGRCPTLAGLLVVGKESALRIHVPTHEIAFQVLSGSRVVLNEFFRWPLLHAVEYITEGFRVRNDQRELNVGLFRVGIPAYDPDGFREALNNAIVHRDYGQLGTIHVQMHDDHVMIQNPGGFVQGIRPENLLATGPKPRNPLLADCFKRIGLVERTGRGVGIIFSGQLRNGRLPPSYAGTTESHVQVTLPGGEADLAFVELVLGTENRRGHAMQLDELLLLRHIREERELTTPEAATIIQRAEPEARSVLESLVEDGLLERRGERRGRTYHLSAALYRDMGQPAAYVRQRGFDRIQMEQMILQYVQAHGSIARREAAELCRISPNQATYVLDRMVHAGRLNHIGVGRNARYEAV